MNSTKGQAERLRIERFNSEIVRFCEINGKSMSELLKQAEIDRKNYWRWVNQGKTCVSDRARMRLEKLTGVKY